MEITEELDANATLAAVVESRDGRLLEGFPVLLANTGQKHNFDYAQVLSKLKKEEDKLTFNKLFLLSLALYQFYNLSFAWTGNLKKSMSQEQRAYLQKFKSLLARNRDLPLENTVLDSSRVKATFQNYFEQDAKRTRLLKERHEELSLEFALSQLFSPKQKELFQKKLEGLPLTKTEREYYSRTVKKRVSALANPELHRLAQKLME
ncbi:MAG: hypothetical protein ISR96_05180 [Nitrospira sp.]|nr:hypothetical protein [Candidatus Brocadiales bacterium]MBL7048893.1 hypothetical protein [Nitrospira sp.]